PTSQSQLYMLALNNSIFANLELIATKINRNQELSGSKKNEIQKPIADSKNNLFLTKISIKSDSQPINKMFSSESHPSSNEGNKEYYKEDDIEIKFDLTNILTEL
ncbi:30635_t:CDS:2, partial [Racocetra persica]